MTAVSALALSAAFLVAGPAAAKTEKTEIHNFYVTNALAEANGSYAAFVDVDADSKKCTRKREASLVFDGETLGKKKTKSNGIAVVSTGSKDFRPGTYVMKIKKTSGCSAARDKGELTSEGFIQ